MKKFFVISTVLIVSFVAVFTLFSTFSNPSGFTFMTLGEKKCTLVEPDVSLGYDGCVADGLKICDLYYRSEPLILSSYDPCHKVCKQYMNRACMLA